ncbi:MAG: hypothetical protein EU539_01520 [Promethearchaeota archaeon]|nr:MAG: hypothetical protein EU539_01520 [Candidatus Lokiarchaeota archaeon]
MKDIITKKNLDKAIELISEFTFDDEEYDLIFKKIIENLDDLQVKQLTQKLSNFKEIEEEENLKKILEIISKNMPKEDLENFLEKILTKQDIVDFIQDLFIEKLI